MRITPNCNIGSHWLKIEYEGVELRYVIALDIATGECTKYRYPIQTADGEDSDEFATETLMLDPAKLHVYICKPS